MLNAPKMHFHGDSVGQDVLHDESLSDFMRESDEEGGICSSNGALLKINNKKRKKVTDDNGNNHYHKRKKFEKDLYKAPTVEEISQLKETENLFHSNLFRLQIEEVLDAVKVKNKYKRLFDTWFKQLKTDIGLLEETKDFKLTDKTLTDELNVCAPVPGMLGEPKGTFKFCKPSSICVIGSFNNGCEVGPNVTVDIAVEMPSKLFQKHDYQNYRYFTKKALYLSYISSVITDNIACEKTFFGNKLRPLLKVTPNGKLGNKVCVHIHVCAQENSFKLSRFSPEKNNVRPSSFPNGQGVGDNSLFPTPHYNSVILRDLIMIRVNFESSKISDYPNLRDGVILLKIWLAQRELLKGHDTFNGHIATMYVLYLLQVRKLNTFMSSYQIVRNVWLSLVQSCWYETGISMYQGDDIENRLVKYRTHYDCVFLDSSGYHNFAAHLTKDMFSWLHREAELSLRVLESVQVDSFQSLFMKNVPFYSAFDHLLRFNNIESLERRIYSNICHADKIDYGIDKRTPVVKKVLEFLRKGLSDRVHRICVLPEQSKQWECTDSAPDDLGRILIGLELNPDRCFDIVEKGPEANLAEAEEFRKFWGAKSELRRFHDGSIREAVVWGKGKALCQKRTICKKIVLFLLTEQLKLEKNDFTYIADQTEVLLKLNKVKITHFVYGTGEEAALRVTQAFDSLEKDLMSLTDMPLSISGVQGASAVLRYTEVFPPLATNHRPNEINIGESLNHLIFNGDVDAVPKFVHPIDVSLQLSTSGKWPDELEAVRKTKAAFHIQIADCLRKQHQLKAHGHVSHVEVLKDGLVFRLRVAHQKEIALLKQEVDEDGVLKYRDNEESIQLEDQLFRLPQLTSALHGLHSQQPSYGPSCCLVKRWLSAQLLDRSHIPDVVVELLVAQMYLLPEPYKPPQMPQVAFLRLLDIFARSQWNTDPVIVNFNNEMTQEEILSVETYFGTSRKSLPPLFVSTPYDHQKSLWTRKAPSQLILNRISVLAGASLKLFEAQLQSKTLLCKPLFRPPLSEFDCVIHLQTGFNPRKLQAVDIPACEPILEWHPYKSHSKQKIPIVDFDPIQHFLRELRDGYDEFALFFHDTYGGSVIGVLLKPTALELKDFKVANIRGRKLYDNGSKISLSISAMIQDFYILGRGVVQSIDVRSKQFSLS